MSMIHGELRGKRPKFFVDQRVHPQTLAVVQTRASGLGVEIVTGDFNTFEFTSEVSGCLVQYPVRRPPPLHATCHSQLRYPTSPTTISHPVRSSSSFPSSSDL